MFRFFLWLGFWLSEGMRVGLVRVRRAVSCLVLSRILSFQLFLDHFVSRIHRLPRNRCSNGWARRRIWEALGNWGRHWTHVCDTVLHISSLNGGRRGSKGILILWSINTSILRHWHLLTLVHLLHVHKSSLWLEVSCRSLVVVSFSECSLLLMVVRPPLSILSVVKSCLIWMEAINSMHGILLEILIAHVAMLSYRYVVWHLLVHLRLLVVVRTLFGHITIERGNGRHWLLLLLVEGRALGTTDGRSVISVKFNCFRGCSNRIIIIISLLSCIVIG